MHTLNFSSITYLKRPANTSGTMHGPYNESSDDEDSEVSPLHPYSNTIIKMTHPQYSSSLIQDKYYSNVSKRRKYHNPTNWSLRIVSQFEQSF